MDLPPHSAINIYSLCYSFKYYLRSYLQSHVFMVDWGNDLGQREPYSGDDFAYESNLSSADDSESAVLLPADSYYNRLVLQHR